MKILASLFLALALLVPYNTAFSANIQSDFENKVIKVLKKNPNLLLELVDKAAQERHEKQMASQLNDSIENPVSPKIDSDRLLFGESKPEIVFVEYTSFQCGFCAQSKNLIEQIFKEHDGQIGLYIKHMPHSEAGKAEAKMFEALRIHSNKAARIFFGYAYDNMQSFKENHEKAINSFLDYAQGEGWIDKEKVLNSYKSKKVEQLIESDLEEAKKFEFTGTPAFVINGVKIEGMQNKSLFDKAIEATTK